MEKRIHLFKDLFLVHLNSSTSVASSAWIRLYFFSSFSKSYIDGLSLKNRTRNSSLDYMDDRIIEANYAPIHFPELLVLEPPLVEVGELDSHAGHTT